MKMSELEAVCLLCLLCCKLRVGVALACSMSSTQPQCVACLVAHIYCLLLCSLSTLQASVSAARQGWL
jgi:hypothetical protein